ncbi:MAG: diacylglycerol kinase family lipid kinase [Lentimicrobium sp.]|nr:diacylglycerol kinase family lipid kinase [Lentimicrobium sp.]
MPKAPKRVLFLVNPGSGVNQSRKALLADFASQHLDQEKYTWEISFSESPSHLFELSRNAADQGVDIIAAVGGDGTVNQVAKGMIGSQSVLGIVPLGSGNGLGHHLHIPIEIPGALEILNRGKIKEIDTGSINDELFVSIAGVGFDALVAKKFAMAKRRGFLSYLSIVTNEYSYYRPRKYKLMIDGQVIRREALFVSFANTNQFGYNTIISPDALIDDGLIDVCIMKKVPLILAPGIIGLLLTRKIDSSGYVEIIKAKEISFSRRKNRPVNIDGEPVKLTKDIHIKVNPASLKVIVP